VALRPALGIALCALALPQTALAAGTVTLSGGATSATFTAGAGDVNELTITATPGEVTYRDDAPGAVINTAVCAGNGTNQVVCTNPAITFWFANLGDMDDRATANGVLGGSISGQQGIDTLTGSDTNGRFESLSGGPDNDVINTRNVGALLITGAVGGDGGPATLVAGDAAAGDEGDDLITTGSGNDGASGGAGKDTISTGAGDDSGSGGADDGDTVDLGPGDDRLNTFELDGSGDSYQGGPGADSIEFGVFDLQPPGGVLGALSLDLNSGALDQVGQAPTQESAVAFEDVRTGVGNDVITGTPGSNTIRTGSGNDQVTPGAGGDHLTLEDGDDGADTRDGAFDRVLCGAGADSVQVDQLDELVDCESIAVTQVRPAGADLDDPGCRVTRVKKRYKRKAFFAGLRPRAACDEAVALSFEVLAALKRVRGRLITAKAGDIVLAERSFRLSQSARRPRLRVPARLSRAIRGGFKARLVVEATDQFGNSTRITRRIRVR
jgi:RTX calcium-binding nonapeptide repeat (4 copies)